MAGRLATIEPPFTLEFFKNITVSHLGTHKTNPQLSKASLKRIIGHQGSDTPLHGACQHAVSNDNVKKFVAVVYMTMSIRHDEAVCIAVKAHSNIATILSTKAREALGMGCTYAIVDVESVWSISDCDHISTKLMKDIGGNVICCPIGTIDQYSKTLKVSSEVESRLTELYVAACSIIQTMSLP